MLRVWWNRLLKHKPATATPSQVMLFVQQYKSSTAMQVFGLLQPSKLSSWRGSHPACAPRARQHLWQVKPSTRDTNKRLLL